MKMRRGAEKQEALKILRTNFLAFQIFISYFKLTKKVENTYYYYHSSNVLLNNFFFQNRQKTCLT